MSDEVRLSLDEVHRLASDALLACGVSADQARAIADNIQRAERDGAKSHGLFRIPFYVRTLDTGRVKVDAVPVVRDIAPAVAQVDSCGGFAPLALEVGAVPLAEKAKANGIAALATLNTFHIGALWPEVERIAERGLVAFAFTSSICFVAPAGGIRPPLRHQPHGLRLATGRASSARVRPVLERERARGNHDSQARRRGAARGLGD